MTTTPSPVRAPRRRRGHRPADPLGRTPLVLVLPAVVAVLLLVLPAAALLVATDWSRLPAELAAPGAREALLLSLGTSTLTAVVCGVLGLPLAWVLARLELPGLRLLRALVTVPLVLPPVVAGVALLAAFGRSGVLGAPLHALTGVTLPYTTGAVVLAHVFVALPFFVLAVEGALRASDPAYERAAATLGATRWTIVRRVTLPQVLPGVVAGLVLAWARSLGEFGATITFAGNYPGTTRTLPLLVYTRLQDDPDVARVLSVLLLAVSLGVLVLLRDRWLGSPA